MWEDIFGSGETQPIIDNGVAGYYGAGPNNDGTYTTPLAAQQYNKPANTAGYNSPMSQQTYGLLTQGIGVLGNLANTAMMIDYKKYEATNGGLFMQGAGAYGQRVATVNPNYSMLILLMLGAVFLTRG